MSARAEPSRKQTRSGSAAFYSRLPQQKYRIGEVSPRGVYDTAYIKKHAYAAEMFSQHGQNIGLGVGKIVAAFFRNAVAVLARRTGNHHNGNPAPFCRLRYHRFVRNGLAL